MITSEKNVKLEIGFQPIPKHSDFSTITKIPKVNTLIPRNKYIHHMNMYIGYGKCVPRGVQGCIMVLLVRNTIYVCIYVMENLSR